MTHLAALIQDAEVVVCVGSGGVGKTTTSATLALGAALQGRRTLVITIDPAKRLADALGLTMLSSHAASIHEEILGSGAHRLRAPLYGMMLDLQAAWDDLVRRVSDDDEETDLILQNRFYRQLSRDLVGAQEFIACETLYAQREVMKPDLIILDTPPTRNALDFLDAPNRIFDFLENDAFQYFLKQKETGRLGRMGLQFLDGAQGALNVFLNKFAGTQFLSELSDFMFLMRNLYPPLVQRTRAFQNLLASDKTKFLVITQPNPQAIQEASYFARELRKRRLPLAGVLANRVCAEDAGLLAKLPGIESELSNQAKVSEAQWAKIHASVHARCSLADYQQQLLDVLQKELPTDCFSIQIPEVQSDLSTRTGLKELLQLQGLLEKNA